MRSDRSEHPRDGVVLVTGASSGIGRATAIELAAAGFSVLAAVRAPAELGAWPEAARSRVAAVRLDLRDPDSIADAIAEVERSLGGRSLRGIVLNAGIALPAPVELLERRQLRDHFEVNVFGHLQLLQQALPLARASRRAGEGPLRVVFVSSVSGRVADPFLGAYAASKHALEAFASSLRREVDPAAVRVSIVEPAAVKTPIWAKGARADLTPFAGTPYAESLVRLRDALLEEAEHGCEPEAVARAIVACVTEPRPRRRRFVSARRHVWYRALPFAPLRAYDWMCRRTLHPHGRPT